MSALVISEILTLFVNTLTADDKYSRRNMLNLSQQVQTPLSQKEKLFSKFFCGISELCSKCRTF